MVSKFLRDTAGSALIEYTVVFPAIISVLLGTVDIGYMLYEWSLASKATYIGARLAVVSDPVAQGIANINYTTDQQAQLAQLCVQTANGQPQQTSLGNNYCASVNSVCTGTTSGGSCTNNYFFKTAAFTNANGTGIFDKMKAVFNRLQPQDVQIAYQTNGLGFVGGQTWTVTVSIQCMTHQFYFLPGFVTNWISVNPPAGCPAAPAGVPVPASISALQSEDMSTN